MQIEFHHFTATLRRLNDKSIVEVCDTLGIDRSRFKTLITNRNTGATALNFAFPGTQRSIYLYLGVLQRSSNTSDYGAKFFFNPRLELHGNFFDNSPDFSMPELVRCLERIGYTPHQLDVAHMDRDHVTSMEDWTRVFADYRNHCAGNIFRRNGARLIYDGTTVEKIQIGNPSTKTGAHGTLYQRPDHLRLEMRYRDADVIRSLLEWYCLEYERQAEPGAGDHAALNELVSNLDIMTADSMAAVRRSGDKSRYEREPFWERFLDCQPVKVFRKALRKEKERTSAESRLHAAKALAGRLNSFFSSTGYTIEEAGEILTEFCRYQVNFSEKPALLT